VDGLIRRLRLKLDLNDTQYPQIKTVHGRGYMLVA